MILTSTSFSLLPLYIFSYTTTTNIITNKFPTPLQHKSTQLDKAVALLIRQQAKQMAAM